MYGELACMRFDSSPQWNKAHETRPVNKAQWSNATAFGYSVGLRSATGLLDSPNLALRFLPPNKNHYVVETNHLKTAVAESRGQRNSMITKETLLLRSSLPDTLMRPPPDALKRNSLPDVPTRSPLPEMLMPDLLATQLDTSNTVCRKPAKLKQMTMTIRSESQ